jgi:hypothetical protein
MKTTPGHHLILGELTDFLTGKTLPDTHDERYRQQLARLLVANKGYTKGDLEPRCSILVKADEKQAMVKVDFKVVVSGRTDMIIKYGPGSLVTRRRSALGLARLVSPYQVPIVVVTNGEDAEIVAGATGELIASGLDSIPKKLQLIEMTKTAPYNRISPRQVAMESRIVYAFEIDDSCPCDETICRL